MSYVIEFRHYYMFLGNFVLLWKVLIQLKYFVNAGFTVRSVLEESSLNEELLGLRVAKKGSSPPPFAFNPKYKCMQSLKTWKGTIELILGRI